MASSPSTVFLVLSLTLATVSVVVVSGAGEAPSPAPTGPLNLTEILTKAGHYNTFVRLLKDTEVTSQVSSLLNNDRNGDGLTVLAPTDAAFGRLRPGTLNQMDAQAQAELVLYHVLPRYYGFVTFETVSPLTPGSASTTSSSTEAGSSTPAGRPSSVRRNTVLEGWRKSRASSTSARGNEICSKVSWSMNTTSSPAS